MATWVYRCGDCAMTFAVEVEPGAEAPAVAPCPNCDDGQAEKAFVLPEAKGGCGCGGGGCGSDTAEGDSGSGSCCC